MIDVVDTAHSRDRRTNPQLREVEQGAEQECGVAARVVGVDKLEVCQRLLRRQPRLRQLPAVPEQRVRRAVQGQAQQARGWRDCVRRQPPQQRDDRCRREQRGVYKCCTRPEVYKGGGEGGGGLSEGEGVEGRGRQEVGGDHLGTFRGDAA
jgi:hypothetical protein